MTKQENIQSPDWVNSSPAPHIKDLICHSVFRGLRVTGWCPGCLPSSCCPPPHQSPRSQRKGVWGSRPAPASWRARTPTCFQWGQTTGGAPPPQTIGTADRGKQDGEREMRKLLRVILKERHDRNYRTEQHTIQHLFSQPCYSYFFLFHCPFIPLTRKGLQFSLTYFPAEELSSQSRRPR